MKNPVIVVFAKPPEGGRAKTRLARSLGTRKASGLARAFLEDTLLVANGVGRASVCWASTRPEAEFRVRVVAQGPGSLGQRLERVFRSLLKKAPWVIAIGSDTPHLPRSILRKASALLTKNQAVLGPATDGGFYLIGLRRCPVGLFSRIPWSRTDTCARMRKRLLGSGMPPAELEEFFDVDTRDDLIRLWSYLRKNPNRSPHSRHLLRTWNL